MKLQKMLFRLDEASDRRKYKGAPWAWMLWGDSIEGPIWLRTSKVGPHETRWDPTKLGGCTLRLTYRTTPAGFLWADLWRPSWAEGEDLDALFDKERTLYLIEKERQELRTDVTRFADSTCERRTRQRL